MGCLRTTWWNFIEDLKSLGLSQEAAQLKNLGGNKLTNFGGTGVSGLTRGLATLPPRWIQEPSVVRDKDGRPPRGPSGSALLLCVCSGSVLLGDLLGVSRSRNMIFCLSCLFILGFFCVCSLCLIAFFVFVLFCYNLMHVRCFGLVVNTCAPLSVWPHLFCGAGHEKRRGEQLKWSLAFRL